MNKERAAIFLIVIAAIIAASLFVIFIKRSQPKDYDDFGSCLKDKNVNFYGAYWCQYCKKQKRLLNDSQNIPYIECSTSDGGDQTQICKDNNIVSYPTWTFSDGTRLIGIQDPKKLSEKSGCKLP